MDLPPPTIVVPIEAGPHRPALGLSAIPGSDWLTFDTSYPAQMAERARLVSARYAEVIDRTTGSGPACDELFRVVRDHLLEHHAERFAGHPWLEVGTTPADPLAAVAGLIAEDVCIVRPEPDGARLIAAVLCFPGRWRLAEKLGRPLLAVHDPVPGYAETLARPVDRFLAALKPGRIAMRTNWGVIDDATLFQPTGHGADEPASRVTVENAGETLVLRTERQTFRPLPDSGTVAFGIFTQVTRLAEIATSRQVATLLADGIRALPEGLARYKSILPFRTALLTWLERRAIETA